MRYKISYTLKSILEDFGDSDYDVMNIDDTKVLIIRDTDDPSIVTITITSQTNKDFNVGYRFKNNFLIEVVDALYEIIEQ